MKKALALLVLSLFVLAGASLAQIGIGCQGLAVTTNAITMPTIQWEINPNFLGEAGLAFTSRGSTSNFTLMFAGKMPLTKTENIRTHWGFGVAYTSNPALIADSNQYIVALNVGGEYFVQPDLSIEANITPLALLSFTAAGATTTTLNVLGSAGAVPPVVIGAHYYL